MNIDWGRMDSLPEGTNIDWSTMAVTGTAAPKEAYAFIIESADGSKNIYMIDNVDRSALVKLLIGIKSRTVPAISFNDFVLQNPTLSCVIVSGIGVVAGIVIAHIWKKRRNKKQHIFKNEES